MKSVIYFLSLFIISISTKAQESGKPRTYGMKEITIPTRWAKEISPNNSLKEYPRPQMARNQWTNLNSLWEYVITPKDQSIAANFEGKILVPYAVESALSGVKKTLQPEQALWYRKNLVISGLKNAERLLLNFGAVSWEATVYLNGKEVGNHKGAYTAFTIDITDAVNKGNNELLVKVTNPLEKGIGPRGKQTLEPNSMWYTASSGIWQTVWMETVPENYIKSIKVTPDVDKGVVNLVVNGSANAPVEVKVLDGKKVITALSGLQPSLPGGERNIAIKIPNAKLWSPDSPHLYDLEITMGKDKVKSYFGMRKVEIRKDEKGIDRIFLNNKYAYNLGTLDQGFWPDGLYTAPTDEALKFDIEAIKSMGFNTIRKHIKVEPARWYYHADKLGVLVWQDLVQPGGKLERGGKIAPEIKQQFEKESAEILEQFNHFPSIITWGLFNEQWGEYDQARLARWIKDTDPTRLVNGHSGAAIVNGKVDKGHIEDVLSRSVNSDMTDVHSYPPPAIPNHIEGKAMVLGEFGGIGVQVDGHLWDDLQSVFSYGKTVGAGQMQRIYSGMVDSLIKFEKQGLSASIYTQPYDVEGEQNGIMTYDRKVTKVPFAVMKSINSRLWPSTSFNSKIKIAAADTAAIDFDKDIVQFEAGKRDSAFLRRLTILAWAKKDAKWMKTLSDAYVTQLNNPFVENNLKFIQKFLRSTADVGFRIFNDNREKVNSILGKDAAEGAITAAIERSEITPFTKDADPDWKLVEEKAAAKYGEIGREIVWQSRVLQSLNKKDWKLFEEHLIPWFEKYGKNRKWVGAGFINNLAWGAFENFSDQNKLAAVEEMTAYGLSLEPDDAMLMDTHANVLHKLGRTKQAIEWEEQAISINPNEGLYKETLEKFKQNQPTWPVSQAVK